MADSTAFPTRRESNDVGYKRISSFAIAGLVIGALFVVFLLLQVLMGFSSHSTVLMPLWLEFLPALGVVLSFLGIRSIRTSDGTLAGMRIAKSGLWLSLVAGLGYASYYGATYLAVRQQADAAVQTWADKLRQGKLNEAFLLTQGPGERRGTNPDDERAMENRFNAPIKGGPPGSVSKGGMLDLFRDNELIYMLRQGGKDTKVIPLGVRSWDENTGSHTIRRVYGIETPEATFALQIVAQGQDDLNSPDKGRAWKIGFMESSVEKDSLKKTPLGQRLDGLRAQGMKFVSDWRALVMKRQLELAYAMTLDPKERKAAEAMIAEKKGPPPGYDEAFVKGGIFDFSNVRSKVAAGKEVVEKGLRNFLSKTVKGDVVLSFVPGIATAKKLWSLDADKRVLLPVECGVTVGPPGGPASFAGELVIWLQSEPGALESKGNADWRITKIECVKVKTIAEAEPGPRAASERFGAQ
jgi:hypothetical protein